MHDPVELHSVIWFLVVGGFVGWIVSLLVEGKGIIGDIVLGVIGGFLGGFFAYQFNINVYGFWGALGMSVVGAVVFQAALRVFLSPREAA